MNQDIMFKSFFTKNQTSQNLNQRKIINTQRIYKKFEL